MEENLLERIKTALKHAEEIANLAEERYRVEAFIKTYEFLLELLKMKYVSVVEYAEETTVPEVLMEELSLPEFIARVNPKSNPERMVVIAYYMRYMEKIERFTLNDIMDRWVKVALKKPGDPNRDFKVTIRKGWISHANGDFRLTVTGKRFVESLLRSKEKKE